MPDPSSVLVDQNPFQPWHPNVQWFAFRCQKEIQQSLTLLQALTHYSLVCPAFIHWSSWMHQEQSLRFRRAFVPLAWQVLLLPWSSLAIQMIWTGCHQQWKKVTDELNVKWGWMINKKNLIVNKSVCFWGKERDIWIEAHTGLIFEASSYHQNRQEGRTHIRFDCL